MVDGASDAVIAAGVADGADPENKNGMPSEIHELAESNGFEDKRPPIHLIKMAENVKHQSEYLRNNDRDYQ